MKPETTANVVPLVRVAAADYSIEQQNADDAKVQEIDRRNTPPIWPDQDKDGNPKRIYRNARAASKPSVLRAGMTSSTIGSSSAGAFWRNGPESFPTLQAPFFGS
jgi:hypothetical protein